MGRIRHQHLVEGVPKKEIARRFPAVGREDGTGVAAAAQYPGPVPGADQAVAVRGAAVNCVIRGDLSSDKAFGPDLGHLHRPLCVQ